MRKLLWFTVGFFLALLLAVGVMLGTLKTTSAEEVTPWSGSPTVTPESTPRPTDEQDPTFLMSLRWQRQRPVSGGCMNLRVDGISHIHYAPCDQGTRLGRFTQGELSTYLVYVARYASFEYSASGDSAVHLSFAGRGSRQPTEAERTELADWIGTVYDRLTREERRSDLVAHARLLLAQRLGVSPDAIGTLSVEQVAWSDACLETRHEGVHCAQVHTPGYRIVLSAGDAIYEFRTNMHDLVRQAENPVPTPNRVTPTRQPTQTPTVTPTATPWPTAVPVVVADWRGEYYANASMSGLPLLVRNDRELDFDWGHGSPAPGLPADFFSAQWSRRIPFSEGNYRFRLAGDDGVRLWVADNLLIDRWHDGFTDDTAELYLMSGEHEVVVEYFEMQGLASVRLSWERVVPIPEDTPRPAPGSSTVAWIAEYFDNQGLSGTPRVVLNEERIEFDWGGGSPAKGIPENHFSARFTRRLELRAGKYLLRAVVDDGVRVYVDDRLAIDGWCTGGEREYRHEIRLKGTHEFRVEYFENESRAMIRFTCERSPGRKPKK